MSTLTLHCAPWIIPISKPVIKDGAVAIMGDRIVESGSFLELAKKYPGSRILTHDNCALLPALVNAHTHLELSHLQVLTREEQPSGFTGWIEKLLAHREKEGATGPVAEKAAHAALMRQHELGVIALADIGNTNIGSVISEFFPGLLYHFNEVLGRSAKSRKSVLKKIHHAIDTELYTAHAPYSTHPELIRAVKNRARRLGHPFSIHAAEPDSENEMISRGSGELFDFLQQRGFVEDSYHPAAGPDNRGSIYFLNSLGVLDKQTICVHCIHVSLEEVKILADTGTKICLCPGSNRYLNVGHAPVRLFLDNDILPALGTDSRASNPELSIWREMRLLWLDNPDVDPADILSMATLGGAMALGCEHDYGTLEQGRKNQFLSVPLPSKLKTPGALIAFLVAENDTIFPRWVQ